MVLLMWVIYMRKPEILSPAGDLKCLVAAIEGGCDAVYLSGKAYGARAFASNFTEDEIVEAARVAHTYGVKVYVAANTLVYDDEVNKFMKYIEFLYKNGVDAVIVQDLGMIDLIKQTFPNFEVHASTQAHIHNLEGVKLMEKLGVSRCVLARETPIDLIKEIKSQSVMEIEIFAHGALCVSYSGQCLMSSLIGGRSGNRGTCAGSCRQKYDVLDKNKNKINEFSYNLSTKDLNTLEHIGELIDLGVESLKIEGRMKSPAYVYLVTKLYRNAVDSYIKTGKIEIDNEDFKDLKKTFNREYTKGFLFDEDNENFINPKRPNHLGIPVGNVIKVEKSRVYVKLVDDISLNDGIRFIGKNDYGMTITKLEINNKIVERASKNDIVVLYVDEKIENGSTVVKTSDYLLNKRISKLLKNIDRKVPIIINVSLKYGEPIVLEVSDSNNSVIVQSNAMVEKAMKLPLTKKDIESKLNRTGDTVFQACKININMDSDIFVPIGELNELRREALHKLTEQRLKNDNEYKTTYKRDVTEYPKASETSVYLFDSSLYVEEMEKFDRIYYNSYDSISLPKGIKKLPRVIERYDDYNEHLLVGELGSVNKYNDVDTDFSLNVVNSYSVALLNYLGVKRIALSYEMNDKQIENLINIYKLRYGKRPNLAVIVYSKEEMMISKFNLLEYYGLKDEAYLRDRFNNLYKIYEKDGLMYLLNYKARNLDKEKYFKMGIDEIRYNIVDHEDLDYI